MDIFRIWDAPEMCTVSIFFKWLVVSNSGFGIQNRRIIAFEFRILNL